MKEMMAYIGNFLQNEKTKTKWVKANGLTVYVRKATHLDETGVLCETFDIANASAKKPGRGTFTRFIEGLEHTLQLPIYIESAQEERFVAFFLRRGYKVIPNTNPVCLIRKNGKEEINEEVNL